MRSFGNVNRPDRILQHLRDKIVFCPAGQNIKAPKNTTPVELLVQKRKKKSLSSLKTIAKLAEAVPGKVFTAKESKFSALKPDKVKDDKEDQNNNGVELLEEASTIGSARRAKAAARIKFIRTAVPPTTHQLNKVTGEDKKDDNHSPVETSNGSLKIKFQSSTKPNSSQQLEPKKISRNSAEFRNERTDMSETLNCLVETASKRKSHKRSTMKENGTTPALVQSNDNDPLVHKVDINKHCHRTNSTGDENQSTPSESDLVKRQRVVGIQEKAPKIYEDLNFPAQPEITANSEINKEVGPIWFCLVAAEENKCPIATNIFLLPKDQVEITLGGQAVSSSLQLKNLVEMWLQTVPTNEIQTSVGSSAKDFIMILSYGRKA
ncbi:hypothetical protein Fmac_024228 [Flemingia macrophylla]|uniref:Uncharacterized protein n=1 Tax=Flemingia macrophylla TaxID=520843 RepID=A0ABD1LNS2_9FABA